MAKTEIVDLARRAAGGDRDAFGELCKKKTRNILFDAYSYVKNLPDAEDITQEVFILMFRNIHTLKDPAKIDGWIFLIVQNQCKRFFERNNRYAKNLSIDDEMEIHIEEDNREFLPEEYAQDMELKNKIYDVVMNLPEKRREAIIAYYYNGLSNREIAEISGTTVQNITSTIMKARKMIKDAIEKREHEAHQTPEEELSEETVLGRILNEKASAVIPEKTVLAVQGQFFTTLKTLEAPMAATAAATITGKVVAIIVASVIGITGITYGVVSHLNAQDERVTPPPAVSEEVAISGSIRFFGGQGTDGHINPQSAAITDLAIDIQAIEWIVLDDTDTELYKGEGEDPAEAFAALQESAADGDYRLKYRITDKQGNIIAAKRTFTIKN